MLLRIWRREKHILVVGALIIVCFMVFGSRWLKGHTRQTVLEPVDHSHKLCVIVPFRDRFDEVTHFVPQMKDFLDRQLVTYQIFIINQVDGFRFNRASLINSGFLESQKDPDRCDYLALHDVDLVPKNPRIRYDEYPESGPTHLAAPGLHPRYDYPDFMGGILLLSSAHFKLLNGMSNRYWGWGLEDDEFRARVKDSGLTVSRPKGIGTGKSDTFVHYHSPRKRSRDHTKCHNQLEHTRLRDRETGLHDVQYKLVSRQALVIDGAPMLLLNVRLDCDKSKTPWCDCTGAEPDKPKGFKRSKDSIMPKLPKKQ